MDSRSRDLPAMPDGDIPFSGLCPRFFVSSLPCVPWAERVVGHFRRCSNFSLNGQVILWEVEKKRTD
jgi:hypothetical protein